MRWPADSARVRRSRLSRGGSCPDDRAAARVATMSVLGQQHVLGRRPQRDEAVAAGDPRDATGVAAVDQGREHPFGDPAARRVSSTTSTRGKAAATSSRCRTGSGASQRRSNTLAAAVAPPGCRRDIPTPLPKVTTSTSRPRRAAGPGRGSSGPGLGGVVRRGLAAGVVERDRLQQHPDASLAERQPGQRAQQPGRLGGARGAGDDDAGDVAQHGDRVVVVEVAAEPL